MSQDSAVFVNVPVLQPAPSRRGSDPRELHALLRQQLDQVRHRRPGTTDWPALLELISTHYERLDDERRGVVRSMQLLAQESRSFGTGLGDDNGYLQAILDHIKDVVITVDAEGAIRIFNPTGERVFGYSRVEVLGQSIVRLLPELPVLGSVARGLQALIARTDDERGDLQPHEFRARHKDGRQFPAELIASRLRIEQRDAYVICLRDTSERVRAEQALRDSEARYRALVESAPELIVVIDRVSGRCVDANENALRFFGTTRASLPGLRPFASAEVLDAAAAAGAVVDAARAFTQLATMAAEGVPQVFPWLHRDKAGTLVETEVRLMALPGESAMLRASITDVSSRRRAEKITAGERNLFERMAADLPLTAILRSIVELLESVDRNYQVTISCLTPDGDGFAEVIGNRVPTRWLTVEQRAPLTLGHGSSASAVSLGRAVLVSDIENDPHWQNSAAVATAAGFKAAWSLPIQAGDGQWLGVVTVYRALAGGPAPADLDLIEHAAQLAAIAIERRRSAAALRDSENKFRSLYEQVLEGVYQCAPDGRLLEVNPAFVKMLGYTDAAEVCRLPGISVLYREPTQRAQFEQLLELHGEIHNAEFEWCGRDGVSIVVLESARAVRDSEQRIVAFEGLISNITARKRAEQAMFAEQERAQVTLQSIGDAVIATDGEGRIDYMNPVAAAAVRLEQSRGARADAAQCVAAAR